MSHILVVGAGLIGAAVACHAAQAGAQVTVVDLGRAGGSTSSATFAWLNANNKTPRTYFDLNVAGMRAHRALKDALGAAPWLHESGNLEWAADPQGQSELKAKVQRLRSWGYAAELAPAAWVATELEPDLQVGAASDGQVAYFPDECWLDPAPLIHHLLQTAERHGARRRTGRVVALNVEAGYVRGASTDRGEQLAADAVVDCAGAAADRVAALAGFELPMANTAGLLAITAPAPTALARIVHAPGVNLRPDGAGRVLLHADDVDRTIDAGTKPDPGLPGCRELLRRAREVLPALDGVPIEAARIGVRPIPLDGRSAIGPLPGIEGAYLAVTHSGATLCLAIGRMVAAELGGLPVPELAPFRPARFLSAV